MYLPPVEMDILKSLRAEREKYLETFAEPYPPFNHDEWFSKDGKSAIDIYVESLRDCLKTNTPYEWIDEEHIKSR